MKLKRNCIFFNANTPEVGGTPDWEHTLGQGAPLYLLRELGCSEILNGIAYNLKEQDGFNYGNGGRNYDTQLVSVFEKTRVIVYDAELKNKTVLTDNKPLIVVLVKQNNGTHIGRRLLKISKSFTYGNIKNSDFYDAINRVVTNPWFGYEITYDNVVTGVLTLTLIKVPKDSPDSTNPEIRYLSKDSRKAIWDKYANEYATDVEDAPVIINEREKYPLNKNIQTIYYGAPGTGKSRKIKELTKSQAKTVVTFHPDTDYASFVGSYKPTLHNDGEKITYGFVPQAFAQAYVNAWKNKSIPYYLVIEEINRGNCAQIFGDIFQLLDRNDDGYSEYVIDIDKDFENYLKAQFEGDENCEEYKNTISSLLEAANNRDEFSYAKIALPANLHILATMNTSDQSLFPMDSAFKRRWDWEYIPINYAKASEIEIEIDGIYYNWGEFIKTVNAKINEINNSEDKQLGNFFVKPINNVISFDQFRSKVMFYLWFEIYKDEAGTTDSIFKRGKDGNKGFGFGDLFENDGKQIINDFMEFIGVKPTPTENVSTETE